MKKIVYISDFFVEHIAGGAEINDSILINEASKNVKIMFIVISNKLPFLFDTLYQYVIDHFLVHSLYSLTGSKFKSLFYSPY